MSVKIDERLDGRVGQLARRRDRSAHWVIREAIRQHVERDETRESFREEALASWAAYRETGCHLTGAEAVQWLNLWGAKADRGMPTLMGEKDKTPAF